MAVWIAAKPRGCDPTAVLAYNASMTAAIYLDHNATTPILPEVAEAVCAASLRYGANPASQHEPGRQARRALEEARDAIGRILGACRSGREPDAVVFTSGGTEANNLAVAGLTPEPGGIVISGLEHPSVAEAVRAQVAQGFRVDRAAPTADGVVTPDAVAAALQPDTRLVCLMLASNETGVVQPVTEVAQLCEERGIALHCDAVQAVGKVPVDFAALGAATMTCAAHKFHGPVGIGVLIVRRGVGLKPALFGGHQQADLRPGTETVALAIGMLTALKCWQREAAARAARMAALRDRLQQELVGGEPSAVVVGKGAERLPNTLNIAFPGIDRQALAMALDLAGVACSTGSACASGSSEPSPALLAMRLEKAVVDSAIRLSLGALTTPAEVDDAAARILLACRHLRQGRNR